MTRQEKDKLEFIVEDLKKYRYAARMIQDFAASLNDDDILEILDKYNIGDQARDILDCADTLEELLRDVSYGISKSDAMES